MLNPQESMWTCTVPVATMWTTPGSVRKVDNASITQHARMNDWIAEMTLKERYELCENNLIQSQLLYGEPVFVESIREGWVKVNAVWQSTANHPRGYPGWVPLSQLRKAEPLNNPKGVARVATLRCQVWHTSRSPANRVISFNSILPLVEQNEEWVSVSTPEGVRLLRTKDVETATSVHHFEKRSAKEAAECALDFLDLPYFWGGMSAYGYDCSGLTYNMFKACGTFIPRDAEDQAQIGESVSLYQTDTWQRGDLLFFKGEQTSRVTHVGFYYGNGQMIHATSSSQGTVELCEWNHSKYANRLCAVRRYGNEKGSLEPVLHPTTT